jgi:hypothetical protein
MGTRVLAVFEWGLVVCIFGWCLVFERNFNLGPMMR